jgi:hypothetical protein
MKTRILSAATIALTLMGSTIVSYPKSAIAGYVPNTSVPCYFFKGETLKIQEICQASRATWAGGGGHSMKWSDGVVTNISFGIQGRGEIVCPRTEQIAVDGKCGTIYARSNTTFKRVKDDGSDRLSCVQLTGKSVCWGRFRD